MKNEKIMMDYTKKKRTFSILKYFANVILTIIIGITSLYTVLTACSAQKTIDEKITLKNFWPLYYFFVFGYISLIFEVYQIGLRLLIEHFYIPVNFPSNLQATKTDS